MKRKNEHRVIWHPIIKSAKIGAINRIASIFIRLLTIPLVINYLGTERFGLWITIASFSAYVMFLDFGIASALVNKLTGFYTDNDKKQANLYITGTTIFLGSISVIGSIIAAIFIPFVDWTMVFKLKTFAAQNEVTTTLFIATLMFLLQLPLSIIMKIPYTMQNGALSEAYTFVGNVITIIGVISGVLLKAGLPFLVFFLTGTTVFAASGLLLHLFFSHKISLVKLRFEEIIAVIRVIRKDGYDFVVMQTIGMILNALQVSILVYYHGAEAIAPFGLMTQVAIALQVPFSVIQQPMWTMVAKLFYEGDRIIIWRMLLKLIKYALLYSILTSVFFLFLLDPVLRLIVTKEILVSYDLKIVFSLSCAAGLIAGGGIGSVLLAMNLSRPMAIISALQLVIFIIAALLLVPGHGAVGIVTSVLIIYLIGFPASLWLIRKKLSDIMLAC